MLSIYKNPKTLEVSDNEQWYNNEGGKKLYRWLGTYKKCRCSCTCGRELQVSGLFSHFNSEQHKKNINKQNKRHNDAYETNTRKHSTFNLMKEHRECEDRLISKENEVWIGGVRLIRGLPNPTYTMVTSTH